MEGLIKGEIDDTLNKFTLSGARTAVGNLVKAIEVALDSGYLSDEVQKEVKHLLQALNSPYVQAGLATILAAQVTAAAPVVNVVLGIIGYLLFGKTVLDSSVELSNYVITAITAKNDDDIKKAAKHFAKGISPLVVNGATALAVVGVAKTAEAGAKLVKARLDRLKAVKTDKLVSKAGGKTTINCFPAGTPVWMETGSRPIEEVAKGERVWAYDFTTGSWRLCLIECRHESEYVGPIVALRLDEGGVEATAYHPVWVVEGERLATRSPISGGDLTEGSAGRLPGRWVYSHEVMPGDVVFLASGTQRVAHVETSWRREPVYNLTVNELHTFAAGSARILVHNVSDSEKALLEAEAGLALAEQIAGQLGALQAEIKTLKAQRDSLSVRSPSFLSRHSSLSAKIAKLEQEVLNLVIQSGRRAARQGAETSKSVQALQKKNRPSRWNETLGNR